MKFQRERLKFVVPIAVIVCVSSNIMLFTKHKDVPSLDKFLIMLGATVLSAILAYFLFPQNKVEEPDKKINTK